MVVCSAFIAKVLARHISRSSCLRHGVERVSQPLNHPMNCQLIDELQTANTWFYSFKTPASKLDVPVQLSHYIWCYKELLQDNNLG